MNHNGIFIPACIAIIAATADADAPPPRGITTTAKVVRVLDGDTLDVAVTTIVRVRIKDCWAPESRTKDLAEKARGIAARDNLKSLLPVDSTVTIHIPTTGRLMDSLTLERVVADVWKDSDKVADLQIEAGHARPVK